MSQRTSEALPTLEDGHIQLVRWVTCPHCWNRFRPEQLLWVAQHEELVGDPVLQDEPLRFLPTRFTLDGQAIDARGLPCTQTACPHCHMVIPRLLLENQVSFFSIIGSVGSGKSNFLAAMSWELRQQLPRHFHVIFSDVDKETNWVLNRYEELLFLPDDPEKPVMLEKTRTQGDLYRSARIGGQETQLPKPFLFSMHPARTHPRFANRQKVGAIVCLYDNAGEHFGVGQDTAMTPVTRHLAMARTLMFLFDPTQDPRFRAKLKDLSHDPQVVSPLQTVRQETILSEAAQRVRKHRSMSGYEHHTTPLLVLVGKSDIWRPLLKIDIGDEPFVSSASGGPARLDLKHVERVSAAVRELLLQVTPEVVAAAEDFSNEVVYLPVSALGLSPRREDALDGLYVRPRDVKPSWASVPLLYAFARWTTGLVEGTR